MKRLYPKTLVIQALISYPPVPYVMNYNNNNNNNNNNMAHMSSNVSVDGYSVGEDTTMLYPTIHRGRTSSKDNMSDWDGYSMDGMSAMGGTMDGYSQFGGSGKGGGDGRSASGGGGSGSGMHQSKEKSRDVYYSGEVPRDFDSVWGDDESKFSMDGDVSVDYAQQQAAATTAAKTEAYADLTQNLNQLVEQEYEQDSTSNIADGSSAIAAADKSKSSASSAGGNLLNEFDSDSASGSNVAGNFTLELLGKKSKAKLNKGTSAGSSTMSQPSVDDEDSILGDMYKDDTESLGIGGVLGDDISAIERVGEDVVVEEEEEAVDSDKEDGDEQVPSSSNDDTSIVGSIANDIQSALTNSFKIFRSVSKDAGDDASTGSGSAAAGNTPAPSKDEEDDTNNDVDANILDTTSESQEQRTNAKFISGLISGASGDDSSSVGSSKSSGSSRSSKKANRKATTAKSSEEKALGLTNSMDEEVDEDPAAMIDNINSMLSECRTILDTENKDATAAP